jgi:hypothetical protein
MTTVYPVSGSPYLGSTQNPNYSGIFIPTIWSGKFVEKFYDATVLGAIASTDYEGEIRNYGDTVNIRTHATITVQAYEVNQALDVQRPSSDLVVLQINTGAYFNTVLDDVMEIQADVDLLSNWADNASEQMKVYVDSVILAVASIGTNVDATNKGNTAGRLSGNIALGVTGTPLYLGSVSGASGNTGADAGHARKIIDFVIDCGLALDENRVPETGRWIVMPPWAAAMIKRSAFQQAYLTGDAVSIARNGRLGMIDRFTVYVSNLLPTGTGGSLAANEYAVYFGHSLGLTFASQMTKVETLRSESTFGTLMRGLQVWGFKVVNPTLVGYAVVINSGL